MQERQAVLERAHSGGALSWPSLYSQEAQNRSSVTPHLQHEASREAQASYRDACSPRKQVREETQDLSSRPGAGVTQLKDARRHTYAHILPRSAGQRGNPFQKNREAAVHQSPKKSTDHTLTNQIKYALIRHLCARHSIKSPY